MTSPGAPIRGKKHLWVWIISNRMLTPVALALPFFLLGNSLRLLDTRLILTLTSLTFNVPLVVWILLGFFQTIPVTLDERPRAHPRRDQGGRAAGWWWT